MKSIDRFMRRQPLSIADRIWLVFEMIIATMLMSLIVWLLGSFLASHYSGWVQPTPLRSTVCGFLCLASAMLLFRASKA